MRVYVEVLNLGDTDLEIDQEAVIWLIAYENSSVGHSTTWVRSTALRYLPFDLAPGESAAVIFDSPPMSGVDWNQMAGLVMVEDRPGGSGTYDLLQATEALPVGLTATPSSLQAQRRGPGPEVVLTGPHVLSWSAVSNVPWIEVTPGSGELPATVTLRLRSEFRPRQEHEGLVTFSAAGDDMEFETTVNVTVGGPRHRRVLHRVAPSR
jgi:hypothetical protein